MQIDECGEVDYMAVSYNGLWKLLIDKNMKKMDLMNRVQISSSTVAKMTNGELVSMKVLEKICAELGCRNPERRQVIFWMDIVKRISERLPGRKISIR